MITSLAQYITGILLKNKIIKNEYLDIYIYGFEVIISGTLSLFIGLTLGLIFSQFLECMVFLVVFVVLRRYTGGYHAETYLKCNTIFAVNILIVMILLKFDFAYPFTFHIIVCSICILTYYLFAPIESIFKPISVEEKKKYRLFAVLIAIITVICSSLLYYSYFSFSIVMDMAMFSVAISMIIEKTRKGGVCDEKE